MRSDPPGERGMSLVEAVVSIAILAVALTAGLLLYDAARKSFKKGENATEQQQSVRISFDVLNADLRMAGFNYNPDGEKSRPDEQIEAAYDTAVSLRTDLDAEDPSRSTTPESTLAGGAFLSVSTGNDEIVTYVLAKPDGSSIDTLTFEADVKDPQRDGVVETVSIPNVALIQNDPPYTLYRVTLNNDTSTWGGSGFIVRTPLVDNVRSMTFRYYDALGNQVNGAFDLSSTTDDIGGSDAPTPKAERHAIRRIEVDLEGLTREPDLGWVDASDTNPATRSHRKFQLKGDVTPRNLGMVGIRDIYAGGGAPTMPGTPSLYPGHCDGLYVSWPANPPGDRVASYRVKYGTSPGSHPDTRSTAGNAYYLDGVATGTVYYVTIEAVNVDGMLSAESVEAWAVVANTTTPKQPQNLQATTNLTGSVKITWNAVTENTSGVSGDPASPTIRDLAGYRVYRTPSPVNPIADESKATAIASPLYADDAVIHCREYQYKVTAVDVCGLESAASADATGRARSTTQPNPPENVQAFLVGSKKARIVWQAVKKDVDGNAITIDTYIVYRSPRVSEGTDPNGLSYSPIATVTGATEYVDTTHGLKSPGKTIFYRVKATDDCPNESDFSNAAEPSCAFSGTVQITQPSEGAPVAVDVPTTVEVTVTGSGSYAQATFEFLNDTTGNVEEHVVPGSGPTWTYDWTAGTPGPYSITAEVENAAGCPSSSLVHVVAGP